jgi:hypothetical protein
MGLQANDVRVPKFTCSCGKVLEAATGFQNKQAPQPGDITLCVYCGALYQFTANMEHDPVVLDALSGLRPKDRRLIEQAQSLIRNRRN